MKWIGKEKVIWWAVVKLLETGPIPRWIEVLELEYQMSLDQTDHPPRMQLSMCLLDCPVNLSIAK